MSDQMSRRGFMGAAATGAVALAGVALAGCSSTSASSEKQLFTNPPKYHFFSISCYKKIA